MRLNDVANQLRLLLPQYTTLFSDFLTISSITATGGTATIVTSTPHGIQNNKSVILNGVGKKTPIASVSQDALTFEFITAIDHDVTQNWFANPADMDSRNKVIFGGFTNPAWNGYLELFRSPNRRTLQIKASVLPVLNGSEYLLEIEAGRMSGAFKATVVNATTFTITGGFPDATYFGGSVSKMPRISVAIDGLDFLERIQTPLPSKNFAISIIPVPVSTSKDRADLTDGKSAQTQGTDFRLRILDGFQVVILAPVHEELSAGVAIDICRHDLRAAIYKCLCGAIFPTGTSQPGQFKAIPIDDAVLEYNKAVLLYSYEFQVPFDLTLADAVPPSQTSAFRDITYELEEGDGLTTEINLDDVPLSP